MLLHLGLQHPSPPLLISGKEKRTAEGRQAGRASDKKTPPPLPPLTQGLDPPLSVYSNGCLWIYELNSWFEDQYEWNLVVILCLLVMTNVPLNETIEILTDWALKVNWLNTTYTLNLTRADLVDLLSVASNGQLFQLNGTSPNKTESLEDALQKPGFLAEWEGGLLDPI